jgi:hypothetical protein
MTAGQVFWLVFIFVPLTILWVLIMMDIMRRPDLLGWHKALWLLVVIFFPWIGAFGYLITRPSDATLARKLGGEPHAAPVPTSGNRGTPAPSAPGG